MFFLSIIIAFKPRSKNRSKNIKKKYVMGTIFDFRSGFFTSSSQNRSPQSDHLNRPHTVDYSIDQKSEVKAIPSHAKSVFLRHRISHRPPRPTRTRPSGSEETVQLKKQFAFFFLKATNNNNGLHVTLFLLETWRRFPSGRHLPLCSPRKTSLNFRSGLPKSPDDDMVR